MRTEKMRRRSLLTRLAAGVAALPLAGCDRLSQTEWFTRLLGSAESVDEAVQGTIAGRWAMAPEFTEADLSPQFKSNGTQNPQDPAYQQLAQNGFADWRLAVTGLVEHPASLSLSDLRALPSRTQITRHDCVEGWSCIGKWKGARLSSLLDQVKPKPEAKYLVFYCADVMEQSLEGEVKYYESMGLADAYHPQTILAYEMNDTVLPIPYGAPLRLRNERQLGYKMAKYIMRIDLVDNFASVAGGKGGYWEDRGYAWYGGI
ncbi:MAG: molybdopterin-binding protein [Alphaproteobacteria bacterium]|nr:molybdopterin-binding protein [Alphaproteobacteria bacterium]